MIERTTIEKTRSIPQWLLDAITNERAQLPSIENAYQRRLQEIELDAIEQRVRHELSGAK
jgi:hypothetical protein